MEYLKIAILPLAEAKNAQKDLEKEGVTVKLDHNETTCRRGCAVTVEMLAKQSDISRIKNFFDQNFEKSLEGHEVDWERLNQVFDPAKESAVCPACGFEFSTSEPSCPDCGLNLGV